MKQGSALFSFKNQLLALVFIAVAINVNTLFNQYVLDDAIVITENKFVEKGFSGVPELLTNSYFKGYDKLENLEFSGGRYRPFALIVFALEHQFFGANPFVSHFINVLLFALLVALLFYLLNNLLFRDYNKYLAFVTCLLFAIHPIHTEVIANVKSRDELITFILLLVSLIAFIMHFDKKSFKAYVIGIICFFLALLTRESAVTFIGVVPLVLYFFYNQSLKKAIVFVLPLVAVFIGYLAIRFAIVGTNNTVINDITNAPFLYASASEAFATKMFTICYYLWLLVFPHPLSFEYGYNQIPYVSLISFQFFFSLVIVLFLICYSIYAFKKKSLISFSILYFFITISLVSNFLVDIGTPLSERLLFQPSLAVCIVAAVLYFKFKSRLTLIANCLLVLILTAFSVKTIARNNVWKNYETLVLTDVKSCPNSLRINQFAMNIYLLKSNETKDVNLRNEYLKQGTLYGERMLKICAKVPDIYFNLGYTYYNLFDYNKAAELWKQGIKQEATVQKAKKSAEVLSTDLLNLGDGFFERNREEDAINCYKRAAELNVENIEAWYKLGGTYFRINDTLNGNNAWKTVRKLSPTQVLNKENFLKKEQ